jgi:hypothetical protein
LLEEWAYVMPYGCAAARNELFPVYRRRINTDRRCHMALGGLTPQQRLAQAAGMNREHQPGGKP